MSCSVQLKTLGCSPDGISIIANSVSRILALSAVRFLKSDIVYNDYDDYDDNYDYEDYVDDNDYDNYDDYYY